MTGCGLSFASNVLPTAEADSLALRTSVSFPSSRIAFAGKWQNFDRKKLPTWFSTVNEFPDQLIKPSEYVGRYLPTSRR